MTALGALLLTGCSGCWVMPDAGVDAGGPTPRCIPAPTPNPHFGDFSPGFCESLRRASCMSLAGDEAPDGSTVLGDCSRVMDGGGCFRGTCTNVFDSSSCSCGASLPCELGFVCVAR